MDRLHRHEAPPHRGSAVEAWLKRHRDRYDPDIGSREKWTALDDVLDDLRDRSDIGAWWSDTLDHTAGHPEVIDPEPEPEYQPGEPLPLHRVAVVVFAEVRAVDRIDAEHVVEGLIEQAFRPGTVHETSRAAMTWRIKVHAIRGLGTAWNYLGLVAGGRAFRDERGEAL